MEFTASTISITLEKGDRISAVLAVPGGFAAGEGSAFAIAHGAGNDMHNPLIVTLAEGFARAGYLSIRFNFPYREKGKKAPDPRTKLVDAWAGVCRYLKEDPDCRAGRIIAGGKSMGGRIASEMAAEGRLPADRLILFGYPLHPPGKKEQRRDAHLNRITIPMLFFAGTRDPLCDLAVLKDVLGGLTASWDLEVIEGGDHSFHPPRCMAACFEEVYANILERALQWLGH
ncbi:MAG: dienelactone hydrolase family protein [Syntrophales bacterium]|jgi:predicted alpha/beta-hydrolase family hydrolase|nr:dienelactone hydrolase family protein [Syntrophales bacterium]MDY0044793.1 dienelactone hydrolase family protein [Syntrophales bacterium]